MILKLLFALNCLRACHALVAKCEMNLLSNGTSVGVVTLKQASEKDNLTVEAVLPDLRDKLPHGFHVHSGQSCKSIGSHYNPQNANHGFVGGHSRSYHAGDFGNLKLDSDNKFKLVVNSSTAGLYAGNSNTIMGKLLVLHQDEDDLGGGGNAESLASGNAGTKIACCVIRAQNGAAGIASSFMAVVMAALVLFVRA